MSTDDFEEGITSIFRVKRKPNKIQQKSWGKQIWVPLWLVLQPWRSMQRSAPKRPSNSAVLYGVTTRRLCCSLNLVHSVLMCAVTYLYRVIFTDLSYVTFIVYFQGNTPLLCGEFFAVFLDINTRTILVYAYIVTFTHSWSWAYLEKLPIVQLLENFPAFYGTRRFITAFT
jgi:hypothetical protein